MMRARLPTFTQDQQEIISGLFARAMETVVAVLILWLIVAFVVGSIVLGRWIGGLG